MTMNPWRTTQYGPMATFAKAYSQAQGTLKQKQTHVLLKDVKPIMNNDEGLPAQTPKASYSRRWHELCDVYAHLKSASFKA